MSVYYGTVHHIWDSHDDLSIATQLDIGSFLLGDMKDNSYYQTYFQIPSSTQPGVYETFTCTAQYNKYLPVSAHVAIRNYEGSTDFSEHPGRTTWSWAYYEDLVED